MTIQQDYLFPVYIYQKTLNKVINICKRNKTEVFGFLIGTLYNWKGNYYIIIKNQVYVKSGLFGNEFSVYEMGDTPYTGEMNKYYLELEKIRQKNPKLLNLGWWHSHPNFGLFLSSVDINTQKLLYYKPYHVALVVDPIRDCYSFFTLDDSSKKGYKEISYAVISRIKD